MSVLVQMVETLADGDKGDNSDSEKIIRNVKPPIYRRKSTARKSIRSTVGEVIIPKIIPSFNLVEPDVFTEKEVDSETLQDVESVESKIDDLQDSKINKLNNGEDEYIELPPKRKRRKRKYPDSNLGGTILCVICGKIFKNKGSMTLHLRTHTGHRPHVCSECGKCFCQVGALTQHLRVHSGHRPYKCSHCDKKFSQLTGLNQHERTHNGQQPYECPVCSKRFSQNGSLRTHERIHSGDKPFICLECCRSFSQRGSLRSHMRTHDNEKPFKCDQCPKSFSQKAGLQHHEKCHLFPEADVSENVTEIVPEATVDIESEDTVQFQTI